MTTYPINWVDITIIGFILLSTCIGLWRGFIKEAFSLIVWIAAFWIALQFGESLSTLFESHISTPSLRIILAFAILFLIVLLLGSLINYILGQLVSKTGLSGTDRLIGVVFGAIRGIALVALLILLANMTPFTQDEWWNQSALIPYFQPLIIALKSWLPDHIGQYFSGLKKI